MLRHVTARDGQGLWRGNAAQNVTAMPETPQNARPNQAAIAAARVLPRLALLMTSVTLFLGVGQSASLAASKSSMPPATVQQQTLDAPKPANPKLLAQAAAADRMLVEADQSVYERPANKVILTGRVQIYYKRSTLQADQVVYLTTEKRVLASGHVQLTEPSGNLVRAETMDVTQGFQEGFVKALRVDSTDRTEFIADTAERKQGNITVFHNGAYSACQYCEADGSPPFWVIRAKTITHNEADKTVRYDDATLEFAGTPIAWVPFFEHPDPTVTRKTGFLLPTYSVSTKLGLAVSAPFYWAPTKDWDATLQPTYLTKQGFLADVQVRHAFESGVVSVRTMGINQTNPEAFSGTSGDRKTRGALMSTGAFTINENWKWGWDGTLVTDRRFLLDYHEATTSAQEATSQLYLTGLGERNYFDARGYAFQIFTDDDPSLPRGIGRDLQNKQPGAGVLDYDTVFGDPVLGGELSAKYNVTNVYRSVTDIGLGQQVYGIAGNFTRASVDVNWRRQFIDTYGQIYEPFAYARGDLFWNNTSNKATGAGVTWVDNATAFRGMPAVGLMYRYPWLITSTFGNHVLEPIMQVVARPNETFIGRLPNEDAQSLVFDDTTLFQADKFSGFDRAEGGSRLNAGLQYTWTMPSGGSVSALFGQSYLLAGTNSFSSPQLQVLEAMAKAGQALPLSTGLGSGLGSQTSDYVSRFNVDTGVGIRLGTSQRFAKRNMSLRRSDISLTGTFGALTTTVNWAYLRTPKSVYDFINSFDPTLLTSYPYLLQSERSELQGTASLKLSQNWRVFGGARYDLRNRFVISDMGGIGYDNDSFSASLSYSTTTSQTLTAALTPGRMQTDQVVYFKFGFRTLGDGSISNGTSANSNSANSTAMTR